MREEWRRRFFFSLFCFPLQQEICSSTNLIFSSFTLYLASAYEKFLPQLFCAHFLSFFLACNSLQYILCIASLLQIRFQRFFPSLSLKNLFFRWIFFYSFLTSGKFLLYLSLFRMNNNIHDCEDAFSIFPFSEIDVFSIVVHNAC